MTSHGVPETKFDIYTRALVNDWVDGLKKRQFSSEILSIKASIQFMDRESHGSNTGAFVDNTVSSDTSPLFTNSEMRTIFNANSGLIESYIADYISHLNDDSIGSLSELFVRRGVYMTSVGAFRRELHYLSSYSLGLQTVEQFAQTCTSANRDLGKPTIFSAPISAVQERVVAFAPFIAGMDLRQLELVVAPPNEPTPLRDHGTHAGIREYSFL